MALVPPFSEKHSEPFDLFEGEQHWGQMRLSQYGTSTSLEVRTDKSGVWKDFQAFIVLDGRLHYGHTGRKG